MEEKPTEPAIRILVVEDDDELSEMLCTWLRERGHSAQAARSVAEAVAAIGEADFDVALLDMHLADGSGIDVLRRITSEGLPTEAVVLTGQASVETAIEAMKLGACDYLTKPPRLDEIEVVVGKAAERSRLRRDNASLRARLQRQDSLPGFIAEDPAMRRVLQTVDRIASSDLPVLIIGESGTGKELIARAVHQRGNRSQQPFVTINCSAVPETLLESELFGHERGAFTGALARKPGLFEVADKGVVFLDEIGDVPLAVQVKLLRVLEEKTFYRVGATRPVRSDVHIVSATNKDLKVEMEAGRFREDLYYRLNGVTLALPPLRDRKADIPLLARHFADLDGGHKKLTPRAIETLKAYPWPGNVRELQMVIRRAALLTAGDTLDASDLPLEVGSKKNWKTSALQAGLTLDRVERDYIEAVLAANGGHRGRTAKVLGIDPKTLYNKLGPEHPKDRGGEEED